MEFHEKLQELRKKRGFTQEELAEALFVSRTAISKWESGRGYPSIDSLKEISKFFAVSIDDLLSSETIFSIAEKENQSNIQSMCDLLFGKVDLCSILLIVLPLYPNTVDTYVYSVNLLDYIQNNPMIRFGYWTLILALMGIGIIKWLLVHYNRQRGQKVMTMCSMVLSIVMVLFFALTREVYAVVVAVLLLVIKGSLLIKRNQRW